LELSARDVLASCEPGERCTVPLGFELAVEGEPLELYWELWLSARDATVGADAEWVEVQLNPAGG